MSSSVICITGIDTDIGKTIVTGLLGRFLLKRGEKVISQKVVQTGCSGLSEDIITHRRIMGQDLLPEDRDGLTCPYVFPVPCSPHLAASLAGAAIDCQKIDRATRILQKSYDCILLEGVGGLFVPLNKSTTLIDYLLEKDYPLVLVSSSRLGSINHTLSALKIIQQNGLSLLGIVYNCYPETDKRIEEDTRNLFIQKLNQYGFPECLIDCYFLGDYETGKRVISFSCLIEQLKKVHPVNEYP